MFFTVHFKIFEAEAINELSYEDNLENESAYGSHEGARYNRQEKLRQHQLSPKKIGR